MSGTPYTALEAAGAVPNIAPAATTAQGPGLLLLAIALAFLFIAVEALHTLTHRRNRK